MKALTKLFLLLVITAGCSKEVDVIPFNGVWTINKIDSKIIYNNSTNSTIVTNDWLKQNDSNLYVIQYKWYIDSNSLVVKDKDIVVGEFILRHKPTDSIGIQYAANNKNFNRAPWFQYKQINRTLILDVDLYYDNVCGVYIPNALKRHLTLTLVK
jgi:hypothetical protein